MSGHSHAKTIKHQKNLADQKKGQAFSKMARVITVAVKEGGANIETNSKLRTAIEMAREVKMPNENIENAIKRALGEGKENVLNEFLVDAYGPGGVAIIVEGITDNTNRAINYIKQILSRNQGKLVTEGAVQWMFERKGCLIINLEEQNEDLKNKNQVELLAIEAGAEDIRVYENELFIYTKVEDLESVKNKLKEKQIKIASSAIERIAKEELTVDEKTKTQCERLFEELDALDDVQKIYTNLKKE